MDRQWTKEEINAWYDKLPWLRGCNFVVSNTLGYADMLQEYKWEEHKAQAIKELKLFKEWGFNIIRISIPFGLYLTQEETLLAHFDELVNICKDFGIWIMPVIGNDCCVSKKNFHMYVPGPVSYDYGYHGGFANSCHIPLPEPGYNLWDDPEYEVIFYEFARKFLTKYKDNDTILIWDLYNEPGNSHRGMTSAGVIKNLFKIAREINVKQPLTVGPWSWDKNNLPFQEVELMSAELSDIITYHSYSRDAHCIETSEYLLEKYGRPIINTEWLHRILHNTVEGLYPYFKKRKIGAINWGFVTGITQTREPWGTLIAAYDGTQDWDMRVWQHDLVRPELTPYDFNEYRIIKECNKD